MAEIFDIEQLAYGLCRQRGVFCAVRPVAAFDDQETIQQQASAYLIGEERSWFRNLRSSKRQAEFCAGRIAAKSVLAVFPFGLSSRSMEIIKEPSGAPRLRGYDGIYLSITHSERFAVAVAAAFRIGVDLERDESRPVAFLNYFFEDAERAALSKLRPMERQNVINQFWCRKEAACKVGRWGSTLEFGKLDCSKSSTVIHERTIHLVSGASAGFVASLAYEGTVRADVSRENAVPSESVRSYG